MIEVSVPKDVFKAKNKIVANMFTGRQALLGAAGCILAMAITFGLHNVFGWKIAGILGCIPAAILFVIAFVEIQGEPIEKIGPAIFNDNFLEVKNRIKETNVEYDPDITKVKLSKNYQFIK